MLIQPEELKQKQSMPLDIKVEMTLLKIKQWYEYWRGNVYVSFSGGKDSTVLLHLVRSLYPDTVAVFSDTGLEYPEIREFVKSIDNVIWVQPKMSFKDVVEKYGFPVVNKQQAKYIRTCKNPTNKNATTIKRYLTGMNKNNEKITGFLSKKWRKLIESPFKISEQCCNILKKNPMNSFEKKSGLKRIIGTMASDSRLRKQVYYIYGCNAYTKGSSQPLSFWLEPDIWNFIKGNNIPYSSIYDMGYRGTGCMFCMFGVHMESHPNRFELMKETHPSQYNYCINKLGCGKVLDFIGVSY